MSTPTLAEIGQSLWGPLWRGDMRDELFLSERTIRRVANGHAPIPAGIKAELAARLRKEARRLDEMAAALEAGAPDLPPATETRAR